MATTIVLANVIAVGRRLSVRSRSATSGLASGMALNNRSSSQPLRKTYILNYGLSKNTFSMKNR